MEFGDFTVIELLPPYRNRSDERVRARCCKCGGDRVTTVYNLRIGFKCKVKFVELPF
jgi:hypothetical protein